MSAYQLAHFDLNLLTVLHVLLEHRSVKLGARHLGLTPSGMSRALGRLRAQLEDELFVRAGGEMLPTEKAIRLGEETRGALGLLEQALIQRQPFHPSECERIFRIGMVDHLEYFLAPELTRALRGQAPGIQLEVAPLPREDPTSPLAHRLDFVVHTRPTGSGTSLMSRALMSDELVALTCAEHAAASGGWDRAMLAAAPHIVVSAPTISWDPSDDPLAGADIERHVAIRLASYASLPALLPGTPFVALVPARMAFRLVEFAPLAVTPLPIALPYIEFALIWHTRSHKDAAHAWMRTMIEECAQRVSIVESAICAE